MKHLPGTISLLGVLLLAGLVPVRAEFALVGNPVPVTRLIQNVEKHVAAHPKDSEGAYTLGRLHSLAFARGVAATSPAAPEPVLPGFPPYESIRVRREAKAQASPEELQHLAASVEFYSRAAVLAPKNSLYWLGLGWMWEQGTPYAQKTPAPVKPPRKLTTAEWRTNALNAYRQAFRLDRAIDLAGKSLGPGADASISLEAGEGILRLLDLKTRTEAENDEFSTVAATVQQLKGLPRAITPIIFPLTAPVPLESLLAPERRVRFDLAADTRVETWSWVKPETGILVWDPQRTGRITSGAQLFGSRTWSMYWRDGYAPLAALDDDGSGWLSGKELDGLAVWCDRNGNAVSEKGEVRPLSALGITRIAVRASGSHGGVPFQERGLQREDGTYLPTYDWTPESIPERPSSRQN